MSNSLPKLSEVVHILKPLSDKYFDLGIQLQLDHKKLKKIEREYADQERRFNETIILWRDSPGECSWSTLATAVERIGGHDKIAKELSDHDMTKDLEESDSKPQRYDSTESAVHGIKLAKVHDVTKDSEFLRRQHDSTESTDDTGYLTKSDSIHSRDSSESEAERFELAPGCGCKDKKPCSLYTLCEGGCPNPTSKRVPILKKKSKATARSEIPVEEEPDLEDYEKSTRDTQKSFGDLGLDVSCLFEKRNVIITKVNLYLQGAYPVMKPRMDEMSRATNFDDIFRIIIDQACSWFDYEIIKDLIGHFCPSAKSCLDKYEARLKKYVAQRLPKGMKHVEVGGGAKQGGKQLVIKIDREWEEVTFSDLDKLRGTFASILGIRRRDLYLADIREGCIMLTFMITKELAGRLFPSRNSLTSSQIKSLKDEGVISLKCGKLSWRSLLSGSSRHRELPEEVLFTELVDEALCHYNKKFWKLGIQNNRSCGEDTSPVVQEIGSTLLLLHCSLDKSAISGTKPVGAVSKVQEKFIMQASADLLRKATFYTPPRFSTETALSSPYVVTFRSLLERRDQETYTHFISASEYCAQKRLMQSTLSEPYSSIFSRQTNYWIVTHRLPGVSPSSEVIPQSLFKRRDQEIFMSTSEHYAWKRLMHFKLYSSIFSRQTEHRMKTHGPSLTNITPHDIQSINGRIRSIQIAATDTVVSYSQNLMFSSSSHTISNDKGLEYTITIRIPEGAVPKGRTFHFETGVYGPFNFPEGNQPLPLFLGVCFVEGNDLLKKEFQPILPHFPLNDDSYDGVFGSYGVCASLACSQGEPPSISFSDWYPHPGILTILQPLPLWPVFDFAFARSPGQYCCHSIQMTQLYITSPVYDDVRVNTSLKDLPACLRVLNLEDSVETFVEIEEAERALFFTRTKRFSELILHLTMIRKHLKAKNSCCSLMSTADCFINPKLDGDNKAKAISPFSEYQCLSIVTTECCVPHKYNVNLKALVDLENKDSKSVEDT